MEHFGEEYRQIRLELENENNICDFDVNGKCIERPLDCSDFKYYNCDKKK